MADTAYKAYRASTSLDGNDQRHIVLLSMHHFKHLENIAVE